MDYEADVSMPFTLMEWIQQIGVMVLGTVILSFIGAIGIVAWGYIEAGYYTVKHWLALRRIAREERELRERRGW